MVKSQPTSHSVNLANDIQSGRVNPVHCPHWCVGSWSRSWFLHANLLCQLMLSGCHIPVVCKVSLVGQAAGPGFVPAPTPPSTFSNVLCPPAHLVQLLNQETAVEVVNQGR